MAIIFHLLFSLIVGFTNVMLLPINAIVSSAFPSFAGIVSSFTDFLNTYITPSLMYFFSILPPRTAAIVILYLELLLILYTISFTIHGLLKVIEIIKAIKIW